MRGCFRIVRIVYLLAGECSVVATLEILTGVSAGQSYDVASGQTVVGRDPFCDIVLPLRSISRQHARIVNESGHYSIEDLGSLNGTFVNGRRISGRTPLKDRDQIQLYEITMRFFEVKPDAVVSSSAGSEAPTTAAEEEPPQIRATIVGSLQGEAALSLDIGAQAKLKAVLEIFRTLGRSLEPEVFLPNVLDSLFEIFPQADRGYIVLADPLDGSLVPHAVKSRHGDGGSSLTLQPISRAVAARVMSAGEAILSSRDTGSDTSILEAGSSSSMLVPIVGPSRQPLGILELDSSDHERRFVREDLEVLWSVGTVAGQSVEYARIHESRLSLSRRERDLATAREVQLHFLPHARPQVEGYEFFDYYQAADNVGGDYFGYTRLPDGRVAIALGDVSGKGVPAALLMARLCSEVRYSLAVSSTAAEAVEALNRELTTATLNDRFVTFLMCVLDPRQHTLEVINAGHLPPLMRRGQTVLRLGQAEAGPPLGLDADRRYETFTTRLAEHDTVVMYTDGISEARSPLGTMYGTPRILRRLQAGVSSPTALAKDLLEDVDRYAAGQPQSDDICLVAFGRKSG